jgi:hypothetical protein
MKIETLLHYVYQEISLYHEACVKRIDIVLGGVTSAMVSDTRVRKGRNKWFLFLAEVKHTLCEIGLNSGRAVSVQI